MKPYKKILVNDDGMALLLTIMVISLLFAVTVGFYRTMLQNYTSSATLRDGTQLASIARSGISLGNVILEEDGQNNTFDSFFDPWATLTDSSFVGLFNRGALDLKIVDYSGQLQLNSLVGRGTGKQLIESKERAIVSQHILRRLLLSDTIGVEHEDDALEIIDSIIELLRSGEEGFECASESTCSDTLPTSHQLRNGQITFLEELLLVKGVTPELLHGSDDKPGLEKFVTVYGDDGKININTAPVEIIQALHEQITKDLADDLVKFRGSEKDDQIFSSPNWYLNTESWPGDLVLPIQLLSTRSSFFQLISKGTFHDLSRQIIAEVERDDSNTVAVISQRIE